MEPVEFADFHEAALEADEIRNSFLLSIIQRLRSRSKQTGIKTWTLGGPGECAAQTPGYAIVLGNLSRTQCRSFAETLGETDYPGVMGNDQTALHFAGRAKEVGIDFSEVVPQRIQAIGTIPQVPSVPGLARQFTSHEFGLFCAWTRAFIAEAVPFDPEPTADSLKEDFQSRRHWLWVLENKAVSTAAIARRTRTVAFINSVYTPPEHRNRGFAVAITAIAAREIFEEGRLAACLYTDLRNPASNRCYAKLGFQPVCESWHLIRSKSRSS